MTDGAAAQTREPLKNGGTRNLANPLWCFHGFRLCVIILTIFGVIMVFSSSSVNMIANGQSPWAQALKQGMYCVFGLVIAFITMMLPASFYRKISFWFLLGAMVMQAATLTPLGVEVNGNKGWIGIPGVFTMQPAEIVKLALCIWMPNELINARKQVKKVGAPRAYSKLILGYLCAFCLVMSGKDLGTGLIILAIGGIALLLGGFPGKWLAGAALLGICGIVGFILTSPNRLGRIMAAYRTCSPSDLQGVCYQAVHGKYAIASGGLLGVGIGNSGEKWGYLPEAHNDFIFAIIGEETGFVGAAMVILLFIVMTWCMLMVAVQVRDRYITMALVCIAVWIVGQAFVNIGVVVSLLPVMGVPMPFVSAGGSSLIMCLGAAGVAISLMKEQPQVKAENRFPSCELRSKQKKSRRNVSICIGGGMPRGLPLHGGLSSWIMSNQKHIVLAGGGTAGHVNPLLAVAHVIRELEPEADIAVVGTAVGLERDLVPQAGFELETIEKVPFPRRPNKAALQFPAKWKAEKAKVRDILTRHQAQVVVGFGGYTSAPVYAAAHSMGIPIAIHEQNARAGMANKLGARWASMIGAAYAQPGLKPRRGVEVERVGLPLRPAIARLASDLEHDRTATRKAAAAQLGVEPDRPLVVVTGGSLGAVNVNRAVAASAKDLLAHAQVIHLTGKGKDDEVRSLVSVSAGEDVLGELGPDHVSDGDYRVAPYLERIDLAFACADLIICRSGAGTVSELTALGLPAIYVPLPIGNGEQRFNAQPVVDAEGGLMVADGDFTPDWVRGHVPELLADPDKLSRYGANAWKYGIRDAAEVMAKRVLALIDQPAD